jgi:hypothetical protein
MHMHAYTIMYLIQLGRLKARYEGKWIEDISINGTEDVNADAEFEAAIDKESGELEVSLYP